MNRTILVLLMAAAFAATAFAQEGRRERDRGGDFRHEGGGDRRGDGDQRFNFGIELPFLGPVCHDETVRIERRDGSVIIRRQRVCDR